MGSDPISPRVTHVILTYNDFSYLVEAIKYSLASKGKIKKYILIIDDGSTDPVEQKLKKLFDLEKSSIHVLRNKKNIGIFPSVHRAVQETKTEYIYLGSCNDQISPTLFSDHLEALEQYPDAAFVFSDPGVYNPTTKRHTDFSLRLSDKTEHFTPKILENLYKVTPFHIGSNTVIYRTEQLKKLNFREDLELYADWFTMYSLAFSLGCVYVPKVATYYRLHEDAYSNLQKMHNNSDKLIKFFEYSYQENRDLFYCFKSIGLISAFPFMEVLVSLKNPVVRKCTTRRALIYCILRNIWHAASKSLPVEFRNKVRSFFSCRSRRDVNIY